MAPQENTPNHSNVVIKLNHEIERYDDDADTTHQPLSRTTIMQPPSPTAPAATAPPVILSATTESAMKLLDDTEKELGRRKRVGGPFGMLVYSIFLILIVWPLAFVFANLWVLGSPFEATRLKPFCDACGRMTRKTTSLLSTVRDIEETKKSHLRKSSSPGDEDTHNCELADNEC